VKLKTSTRISIVTVLIVTLLSGGIGGFAAIQSRDSEIRAIDDTIATVIKTAIQNPSQPIGAALFAVEEISADATLTLLSRDGNETVINESSLLYLETPRLDQIEAAAIGPVTVKGADSFRMGSVAIEGGDFIIIAISTKMVREHFSSNLQALATFIVVFDSAAFIILFFYFRKLGRIDERNSLARMQEFLGDASHELRTPLTVIKGYIEMLSKNQLVAETDKARAFDRVGSEIKRMENLVRDLLLLAELGESENRDVEKIDFSELVQAHATDFTTLNTGRNCTVEIESGLNVMASRDYLARLMQNALTNISKHTPSDAPVKITLTKTSRVATLSIEDGGPGLPIQAYREDVRSLNRFDKSRSRDSGGSGLGMSIMSAVVSKLDGKMSLRKSELGGLAILVELPLIKD
jgi:K+-sensing histidine kinase KdpD